MGLIMLTKNDKKVYNIVKIKNTEENEMKKNPNITKAIEEGEYIRRNITALKALVAGTAGADTQAIGREWLEADTEKRIATLSGLVESIPGALRGMIEEDIRQYETALKAIH